MVFLEKIQVGELLKNENNYPNTYNIRSKDIDILQSIFELTDDVYRLLNRLKQKLTKDGEGL